MSTLMLPGKTERLARTRAADWFVLPVGTDWVRRDTLRITAEIERLWPTLRVCECRCGHCLQRGHWPFLVVELTAKGETVPVFGVEALDGRVLRRLYDAHRDRKPLERMNAANARARAAAEQVMAEERAERLEVVGSALRSHKHRYTATSMGMETTG